MKHVAILIPLISNHNHSYDILFEVRSQYIGQPGEICLPGGKVEEGETMEKAAIRETCEELLITKDHISNLQHITSFMNTDRMVHVFVGFLSNYQNTFYEHEVAKTFTIPEQYFMDNEPEEFTMDYKAIETEGFPYDRITNGKEYPFRKIKRSIYFYPTEHGWIWGLTANLLRMYKIWKMER